jgi:hypothetical protein
MVASGRMKSNRQVTQKPAEAKRPRAPLKLTPEKLTAFCAALAESCNVGKACAAIDVARVTAYKWRAEVDGFRGAWDEALEIGVSALEDEAHRRAFEGVDKPLMHQGLVATVVREYSDTLAIFLLKAHAPEKYRERSEVQLNATLNISEKLQKARERVDGKP